MSIAVFSGVFLRKRVDCGFVERLGCRRKISDVGKKLENSFNNKEILDDVLKALTAIEDRAQAAMEKYAGTRSSSKRLKKCKKIIDTCDNQLNTLEMFGISRIDHFTRVRDALDAAIVALESALAGKSAGNK